MPKLEKILLPCQTAQPLEKNNTPRRTTHRLKSACLRGPNLYGQTFSISLKFCRKATIGLKLSRAKGVLPQLSESAIPACPSKMAKKSPHIRPRERVLPQRIGMEYKRDVIASTYTHLSTLQKIARFRSDRALK